MNCYHKVILLLFLHIITSSSYAETNYCTYGSSSYLLLIDRTSEYDEIDQEILSEGLAKIFSELSEGDNLVVHTIADSSVGSEKVFESCYPGCPNSGFMDWLIGTCKPVMARKERLVYQRELATKLHELLIKRISFSNSAIIQTISDVTNSYPGNTFTDIIIYSDLLENSEFIPWPKVMLDSWSSMEPLLLQHQLLPKLADVRVKIIGFGRGHNRQRTPLSVEERTRLRELWSQYFKSGGASDINFGQWY